MAIALALFMTLGSLPVSTVYENEGDQTAETTEQPSEQTPAPDQTDNKQEGETPAENGDPAPSAETAPAAEEINKEGSVPADCEKTAGDKRCDKRGQTAGTALQADHGRALISFKEEDNQNQHGGSDQAAAESEYTSGHQNQPDIVQNQRKCSEDAGDQGTEKNDSLVSDGGSDL